MTSKDTPAFPGLHPSEDCRYQDPGMTLRDYFAAKAMQSFITATADNTEVQPDIALGTVARMAYMQADAMLEAREK